MHVNRGVIRLRDCQVQGVVLRDKPFCIINGISPNTRGCVGLIVLWPEIRVFFVGMGIGGGINGADDSLLPHFLNDAKRADTITTAYSDAIGGMVIYTALRNGLSVPLITIPLLQDKSLNMLFDGILIDFIIDNAIADGAGIGFGNGVPIYFV